MVVDYVRMFYGRARDQSVRFAANNAQPAQLLAKWKKSVRKYWPGVSMQLVDSGVEQISTGDSLPLRIKVDLQGLEPNDVKIECLIGRLKDSGELARHEIFTFTYSGIEGDHHIFELDLSPELPGLNHYRIRMYPYHELLSHPFEMGYMSWL
jgi:starch phosphorylase